MSQYYFDTFVNRLGPDANLMFKVNNHNRILNEEINNWTED